MTFDYVTDGFIYNSYESKTKIPVDNKYCVIPRSISSLNGHCLYNCSHMVSLYIPDTVTFIRDYAFSGFTVLTNVRLPADLHKLAYKLFSGCSSLKNVLLPSGLTAIASCAFQDCSSLESIYIPDSVNYIADGVFDGCKSLRIVSTLATNRIMIHENVFSYSCEGLVMYRRYSSTSYWHSKYDIGSWPWEYERRNEITTHPINLCMVEMFETALLGVLSLLEAHEVDDFVNIGVLLVCDYLMDEVFLQ